MASGGATLRPSSTPRWLCRCRWLMPVRQPRLPAKPCAVRDLRLCPPCAAALPVFATVLVRTAFTLHKMTLIWPFVPIFRGKPLRFKLVHIVRQSAPHSRLSSNAKLADQMATLGCILVTAKRHVAEDVVARRSDQ